MSEFKTKVLEAIDSLTQALDAAAIGEPEEVVFAPTPEEIGLNVAGNARLAADNPKLYSQMAPFYNPNKQPFTSDTWLNTLMMGYDPNRKGKDGFPRDARPTAVTQKDGKPFRRMPKQIIGPDWYWIGKGISDVSAPEWNAEELTNDLPREDRLDLIRNYRGGLNRSTDGWPALELAAWRETH